MRLTLILVLLLAAGTASAGPEFVFVTTTDYSTGSSSTIDPFGSYSVTLNVAPIHSDAVARYYNGHIYVINRIGADNIQILDPNNSYSTVRQFSTGNLSNPLDVAFAAPDKMYVSRGESNTLWIMNPQTGAQTGSVDLSAFADADGLCEMQYMILIGDRLFISLQRLDRNNYWSPAGTSYIAVIDVTTDTLIDVDTGTPGTQAIALANADPLNDIQLDGWSGDLYVPCVGFWGLLDGGVERVDPVTLASTGTIFTESAAGGDILDVVIVNDHLGYAIIQNASFNTDLISFDPSTGLKLQTLYAPGAYVLQDIERGPTGELFLSDRTPVNPGIRIYDSQTGTQITSNPVDTGLPPFDISFSAEVITGVDAPAATANLGQNFPNPFNPSTTIPFVTTAGGHVALDIFDITGRRVAGLIDEHRAAGNYQATWNGTTDAGGPAPSGIYFVRLRAGGQTEHRKIVLLK